MDKKWIMIGLVGCGLLAFGYMTYMGSKNDHHSFSGHSPISVAAVRGGQGNMPEASSSASEITVDYARSLQSNMAQAEKAADKYEAAAKSRAEQYSGSVGNE